MPVNLSELRKAREILWYGLATIYGAIEVTDPITGITKVDNNALLYENVKCKLSHKTIQENTQTDGPALLKQVVKVSIGNEINIPSGCKFVITQNGKTETYRYSGEIAAFLVHQEVPLVLEEEYA